jgi:hypothetical protein
MFATSRIFWKTFFRNVISQLVYCYPQQSWVPQSEYSSFGAASSEIAKSVTSVTVSSKAKIHNGAHTRSIMLRNIACCATWLTVYGVDWLDREWANLCCAKQFCATWCKDTAHTFSHTIDLHYVTSETKLSVAPKIIVGRWMYKLGYVRLA